MDEQQTPEITVRIRDLETFRAITEDRQKRWESDRESEKRTLSDVHRTIFEKLSGIESRQTAIKEALTDRVDDKISKAIAAVQDDMHTMHRENKDVGNQRDTVISKLDDRVKQVERYIWIAAGGLAALQIALQYFPKVS